MIEKTRAIVLHQFKYSESSVVATLYTELFGRISCMAKGIRSTKSKQKAGFIQPLFLLETEIYYKGGRDMQNLKEFRLGEVYQTIPSNVVKSTIMFFLSEVLYKTIRNEEADTQLFEFIYNSLLYFDTIEKGYSNFHLWFLTKLLTYIGFQLKNNYSSRNCWFDMKTGSFTSVKPSSPTTPGLEESFLLSKLIGQNASQFHQLSCSGSLRTHLLELLIEYYSLHLEGMGTINSLKILEEIYH